MKYKLYMAGKMKDITVREAIEWAKNLDRELIECGAEGKYLMHIPAEYYNYDNFSPDYNTEREVMLFDLSLVRKCDILIVNLKDINNSVGSHFEIATAYAVNSFGDKHIAIIGLGDVKNVHPWIIESFDKVCENTYELADYLMNYYLRTFN